jgi:HK97 family phage portal protein
MNIFHSLQNLFASRLIKPQYTSQLIGQNQPIWINTNDYWKLYQTIPELQAVINRYAKMVASANPIVCDEHGDEIEQNEHWIFDLIDKPNAMQSWGKMIEMVAINKCVTANALIYSPRMSFGTHKVMTPIAWNNIELKTTGKGLDQMEVNGIISEFLVPMKGSNQRTAYKPKDVIYLSDVDGINLFDTTSRIEALRYPLSNLEKQYEKRNSLLQSLFSPGILSMTNDDGISQLPLDPEDRKQVTDDFMQRNTGKPVITDKKLTWSPMSFPVKDLMLFEEMNADKIAIIDAYGLNTHMFGQEGGKGSTFNNVEMGEKQAYNSTIIPETEMMYDDFNQFFGLEKIGMYLKPSFKHISALKNDETKEAQALDTRASAVEKISQLVTLTDDEKRALLLI